MKTCKACGYFLDANVKCPVTITGCHIPPDIDVHLGTAYSDTAVRLHYTDYVTAPDPRIAALEAEVLALRADRERLDAVEENAWEIQVHYDEDEHRNEWNAGETWELSVRGAIDAARREAGE